MLPCAPAADFAAAPAIVCTCLFLCSSVKNRPKIAKKSPKLGKKNFSSLFFPQFLPSF